MGWIRGREKKEDDMICMYVRRKGRERETHGASCGTLFLFSAKLMTINCRGKIRGVGTREIVDNLGAIFLEITMLMSRNKYVVPYLFPKHLATPRFPYIHALEVWS